MNQKKEPPAGAVRLDRSGHTTYHLTPRAVWGRQSGGISYLPEPFAEEGFIHCTDALDEIIAVGNRYYRTDPRPYVALAVACDRVEAPIVYEDPARWFPHIYGALDIDAVESVLEVARDPDGTFLAVESGVD